MVTRTLWLSIASGGVLGSAGMSRPAAGAGPVTPRTRTRTRDQRGIGVPRVGGKCEALSAAPAGHGKKDPPQWERSRPRRRPADSGRDIARAGVVTQPHPAG